MSDKSKKHSKEKLVKPAFEKKQREHEKISKKELEKVHGGASSNCSCSKCGSSSCSGGC